MNSKDFTLILPNLLRASVLLVNLFGLSFICTEQSFAQSQLVKLVPTPHMQVIQMIKEGKKTQAKAYIDNYLLKTPNDPQMIFLKAKILSESSSSEDRDAAQELYTNLSESYPELPEPHNNLGVIFAAKGDYAQASAHFKDALKANPGYALASENLADVYLHEASDLYKNALTSDPSNRSAQSKLETISPALTASSLASAKHAPPPASVLNNTVPSASTLK